MPSLKKISGGQTATLIKIQLLNCNVSLNCDKNKSHRKKFFFRKIMTEMLNIIININKTYY